MPASNKAKIKRPPNRWSALGTRGLAAGIDDCPRMGTPQFLEKQWFEGSRREGKAKYKENY